jgi:ABC-2 type transport system ATP-binding protein
MQDLGAMLDNPHLYSHLTVEQNLRLFARLSGPVSDEQIDRALRLLGLEDKKRHVSGTLSHGQKQRVGIAQALLPDNHLLLLDEPQNGLDPLWVKNLRELLKNLSAEGISILISSHRLHEIEQVCDRVGIIHKGEMLYEGPVGPLLVSDDFVSLRCAPRETPLEGPTPLRPHSIASGNQPVLTFLAQQGIESKPGRNGSILVKAADDNAIAKVNRLLVENRFDVSEIVQTRMTLEEMFLQLTHDKESMTISPLAEGEGQE